MAAIGEWLVAAVGGGKYGLPVGSVAEIVEIAKPARIPLAPDFVRGMVNNKGEILPIVDAGILFSDRPCVSAGIAVVMRHHDASFGFLVQGIEGIREFPRESVAATGGSGYRERFFAGTVHDGGGLLTLVNLDGVVPFVASSLESIAAEGAIR